MVPVVKEWCTVVLSKEVVIGRNAFVYSNVIYITSKRIVCNCHTLSVFCSVSNHLSIAIGLLISNMLDVAFACIVLKKLYLC